MHKRHVDSLSSKENRTGSAIKPGVPEYKRGSCAVMYVVGRKVMHGTILDYKTKRLPPPDSLKGNSQKCLTIFRTEENVFFTSVCEKMLSVSGK